MGGSNLHVRNRLRRGAGLLVCTERSSVPAKLAAKEPAENGWLGVGSRCPQRPFGLFIAGTELLIVIRAQNNRRKRLKPEREIGMEAHRPIPGGGQEWRNGMEWDFSEAPVPAGMVFLKVFRSRKQRQRRVLGNRNGLRVFTAPCAIHHSAAQFSGSRWAAPGTWRLLQLGLLPSWVRNDLVTPHPQLHLDIQAGHCPPAQRIKRRRAPGAARRPAVAAAAKVAHPCWSTLTFTPARIRLLHAAQTPSSPGTRHCALRNSHERRGLRPHTAHLDCRGEEEEEIGCTSWQVSSRSCSLSWAQKLGNECIFALLLCDLGLCSSHIRLAPEQEKVQCVCSKGASGRRNTLPGLPRALPSQQYNQ